ncbi:MAG: outer membrane protein assembly factor [bacterium]
MHSISSKLAFLPVLFLISLSNAYGQKFIKLPDDSTSTDKSDRVFVVLVQGNEKTQEETILREMKLKPGDKLDSVKIEQDRLRIQNLGIFNRVEIDQVPTPNGTILVVTVSEMWSIFPYPIIFRNERDWSRISVGAGLLHLNFRGRREIIDFSFWLGFNPSVRLSYSNPWIFGKLKFYTSISVFAKRVRNKSFTVQDLDVDEHQVGFAWRIGKRFGHFTYLDVNLGYTRLSSGDSVLVLSSSDNDKLPSVGLSFTNDTRDLWEYTHRGHYVNLWIKKTGWFGNTIDFYRYGADFRQYFPVGKTTLAFRGAANLAHGTIPIYRQVHLGFLTRIRGHFRSRASGENLAVGNFEFRFPIRKITYHNWKPLASMGRYGSNLRFGISGAIFIDTGAVWFQGEKLTTQKFITGWGAGLHFHLPYMNLLRVEYGFNEHWDGQLIVDALVAF